VRHKLYHPRRIHRRIRRSVRRGIRRGFHRPLRRGGGLLGLVGLAALGYTLLEKNRREEQRLQDDGFVHWEDPRTEE
jgi:nitroreductase